MIKEIRVSIVISSVPRGELESNSRF